MKNFNANYLQSIIQLNAEPQAYVKITTTNGYDIYLTTHTNILSVSTPDILCDGVISGLVTGSEEVTPEKGFSVRGSGSIQLNESLFTTELRTLFANNKTIFNQKCEIYSGTADLDIADFEKVKTMYIEDIDVNDVSYSLTLTTSQLFSSKKIFTHVTTQLFTSFDAGDELTEIEVLDTTGFDLVAHDAEWEDSPSEEVGYLEFIGQDANGNDVIEVIKYWSKDATKFYGDPSNSNKLERSCFGTGKVTATGTTDSENATEVKDHIYIDLASGKMVIALLTGELYGQVGKTLPDGWHAGLDSSLLNITSLENIGFDLWNPTNDKGFHFYIYDPDEADAKSYIAREILRVAGLAFIDDVNGEIKAKRYEQIIQDSSVIALLENNDVTNKPNFNRSSSDVRNVFPTRWDYRRRSGFIRNEIIVDLDSQERNGIISRAENIDLKAIRNNQTEVNQLLKTVTDGIRTRLTNPSIKPNISTNFRRTVALECMDVIGLDLVGFSDYESAGDVNRPFEIQQIQHDWIKRTVSMQTYGATAKAGVIDISSTSAVPVIDHTGWDKFEDNLTGTFGDTGTVLTLTSDCYLGVAGDLGATKKYYYDGLIDLNGFQLDITGTVIIDANFNLINSTIYGEGLGSDNGEGQSSISINASTIKGQGGYFGAVDTSDEGVSLRSFPRAAPNAYKDRNIRPAPISRRLGNSVVNNLIIDIDQDGVVNGLPLSFHGIGGSGGMAATSPDGAFSAGRDGGIRFRGQVRDDDP